MYSFDSTSYILIFIKIYLTLCIFFRKNKSKEVSELKEAENIASELSTLAFGSK